MGLTAAEHRSRAFWAAGYARVYRGRTDSVDCLNGCVRLAVDGSPDGTTDR